MLSENEDVVPDTEILPPMYRSFPTDTPPPTVNEPPVPTPVAFVESRMLIGLNS